MYSFLVVMVRAFCILVLGMDQETAEAISRNCSFCMA